MKRAISFMNWEGSLGHNTRAFRQMWMLTEQKIISLLCMKI